MTSRLLFLVSITKHSRGLPYIRTAYVQLHTYVRNPSQLRQQVLRHVMNSGWPSLKSQLEGSSFQNLHFVVAVRSLVIIASQRLYFNVQSAWQCKNISP
jgi:hypothetical protein